MLRGLPFAYAYIDDVLIASTSKEEYLEHLRLSIHTALKTEISTTAAEVVYGTTLQLPGEFFSTSIDHTTADPSDYNICKSFKES